MADYSAREPYPKQIANTFAGRSPITLTMMPKFFSNTESSINKPLVAPCTYTHTKWRFSLFVKSSASLFFLPMEATQSCY